MSDFSPARFPVCIVTDLDHTLVGNPAATMEFNRKILAWGDRVTLIYATGRSFRSAKVLQARENLLEPAYWITGVGSEIYRSQSGTVTLETAWGEQLSRQWDHAALMEIAKSVSREFPVLIPQPEDEFNEFKISFYLYDEDAEMILDQLRDRIVESGYAAQVIYSSQEDVDILPIRCDKGLALRYLMNQLGFDNHNTIVCGDSGNDIGLFKQNTLGIVVGNARSELVNWCRSERTDGVFFASSDCAAGILEGLSVLLELGG